MFSSQLQPLCRAHCRTARWPPLAAPEHVLSSHLQPLWRAHCSTARWPPSAALAQVHSSQLQPLCCAHCRTARCPIWLRMSTCAEPKHSHSGAAIAATPGGLQQLLQRTTILPVSGTWTMHLYLTHGHPRSDQLAARLLAAPAGHPVQRLGGACREGISQDLLSGLVGTHPATSRTSLVYRVPW